MNRIGLGLGAILVVGLAGACGVSDPGDENAGQGTSAVAPGALVKLELASTVGVLLDDVPAGPQREAAAAEALAKSEAFWRARAMRQARLTYYRLVFRGLYYSSDWSNASKARGPLPLPPKNIWNITLKSKARRDTNPQHDTIVLDYAFDTHILTDAASPGDVEPNLGTIGGTWDEGFSLPTDPDLLLERTGYACMDEDEYPPGSVFEENTYYFYDDACKAGGASGCHLTQFPQQSCVEALNKSTGVSKTAMHFTRLPWDAGLANKVRVGMITNPNGADLAVVKEDMENEHRMRIKFFDRGSCELEEGVIAKLGWRKLLTFSATVQNNGAEWLHIGDVKDANSPWIQSKVFEFSACHGHYHFSHYGTFDYNGAPGSKRAFCLEDTNRFHNDENTPLRAAHQSCQYQGITQGWGDEYEFGIPGQWVDVTDVDSTKRSHNLTFSSNPDRFLCEGHQVLDANGNPLFEPSEFKSASGDVVGRVKCDMPTNWNANNIESIPYTSDGGSFVTEPCDEREPIGPLRNCGFKDKRVMKSCTPGATVNLECTAKGAPTVLRACEVSAALGQGTACTLADSRTNVIVGAAATKVSFACPAVRDNAPAGGYALYETPVLPSQAGTVSCVVK